MKNKPNKKRFLRYALAIGAFVLISGLGGGGYKWHKKQLNNIIESHILEKDSLIKSSLKREDSLIKLSTLQIDYTNQLREQTDQLQSRNNSLYYELQKRNKRVFIIDNDFMSNARRISDGVNRFYKSRDTLR